MPASRTLLKSARLFHLYSGVFFAPALLFFAFTGSVQSMNFHETTRGSNYKRPAILVKLAQLHKKETLVLPERKAPPQAAKPDSPAIQPALPSTRPAFDPTHLGDHTNQQKHDRLESRDAPTPESAVTIKLSAPVDKPTTPGVAPKEPKTLPLKIFSFWAGVGLFLSTLTGLYMSYSFARNKIALTATLALGLILPLVLLYLQ